MSKKIMIFTFVIALCIFGTASAQYGGRISLENKTVQPGQSFVIKLLLSDNDAGLTSLRVPLKFDSQHMTCTYVDFGNSLIDPSMTGYYSVDGDVLDISFIPSVVDPLPEITAESGEIAAIYFTVDLDAPDMMTFVDSLNEDIQFVQYNNTFHQWRRVEATDQSGTTALAPGFMPGLIQIDRETAVDDENRLLPTEFALDQNHPNPFNPTTTIAFSLPAAQQVRLEIFNLLGQSVAVIADGNYPAGFHELTWDAGAQPSGIRRFYDGRVFRLLFQVRNRRPVVTFERWPDTLFLTHVVVRPVVP